VELGGEGGGPTEKDGGQARGVRPSTGPGGSSVGGSGGGSVGGSAAATVADVNASP